MVTADNKIYALKICDKNSATNEIAVYGMSSSCESIIKLYDTLEIGEDIGLLLEFMDKGSLGSLVSKENKITMKLLSNYALQMIIAISFLHKHNIIINDIKPDNILLNSRGEVKFTDFGLSYFLNQRKNNFKWLGTTKYHNIGKIKGTFNKNVDIWAFSVTILELALGEFPFPGNMSCDFQLFCFLDNESNLNNLLLKFLENNRITKDLFDFLCVGFDKNNMDIDSLLKCKFITV